MGYRDTTAAVNYYFSDELLEDGMPDAVHLKFFSMDPIGANADTAGTLRKRRMKRRPVATTPLARHSSGEGQATQSEFVTVTYYVYGDWEAYDDVEDWTITSSHLSQYFGAHKDQHDETLDELARDVMVGSASQLYAGDADSVATIAAADVITEALYITARQTLKLNSAKYVTKMVRPGVNISTEAVNPGYVALVPTEIVPAHRAFTNFLDVKDYASGKVIDPLEFGSIRSTNMRFVETNKGYVEEGAGAGGVDVYKIPVFGMDAYFSTEVSGHGSRMIIKPKGSSGTADPLDREGTMGWKATWGGAIQNEDFCTTIVVTDSVS